MNNPNQYWYSFKFYLYTSGGQIDEKTFQVTQTTPTHPARTAMDLATKHASQLANQHQQKITIAMEHTPNFWHVDPMKG
jgi:hypothetical protein